MSPSNDLIEVVRQRLASFGPRQMAPAGRSRAAVILLLYEIDGEPRLLFTRRTENVEHHKGQICFPGGGHEESDGDLLQTALREAFEEVGVRPEHVEPIGKLSDIASKGSNFVISPYVGLIAEPLPYPFSQARHEVDEILEVPLRWLMDDANVSWETYLFDDVPVSMPSYVYGEQVIWGATARILKQLLDLVKSQPGSSTRHLDR